MEKFLEHAYEGKLCHTYLHKHQALQSKQLNSLPTLTIYCTARKFSFHLFRCQNATRQLLVSLSACLYIYLHIGEDTGIELPLYNVTASAVSVYDKKTQGNTQELDWSGSNLDELIEEGE